MRRARKGIKAERGGHHQEGGSSSFHFVSLGGQAVKYVLGLTSTGQVGSASVQVL